MSAFAQRCCGKDTKWRSRSLKVYGSLTKGLMKRALSKETPCNCPATDRAKQGQGPLFHMALGRFPPRPFPAGDAAAARTGGRGARFSHVDSGNHATGFPATAASPKQVLLCKALYIEYASHVPTELENAICRPCSHRESRASRPPPSIRLAPFLQTASRGEARIRLQHHTAFKPKARSCHQNVGEKQKALAIASSAA